MFHILVPFFVGEQNNLEKAPNLPVPYWCFHWSVTGLINAPSNFMASNDFLRRAAVVRNKSYE